MHHTYTSYYAASGLLDLEVSLRLAFEDLSPALTRTKKLLASTPFNNVCFEFKDVLRSKLERLQHKYNWYVLSEEIN